MAVDPGFFGIDDFTSVAVPPDADYPIEDDVRFGVSYGSGTYTGTLTLPDDADVRFGITYGADGTEFTGTLAVGGGTQPDGPHSPADVVRWLLIQLGIAAEPPVTPWPAYCSSEPNFPDDCVTVYDVAGVDDGRLMVTGEAPTHYGVQVRVRATDHATGYAKASEIRDTFAEDVLLETVTISDTTYLVQAMSRIGNVIALGKETPAGRRSLFTCNATVSLKIT